MGVCEFFGLTIVGEVDVGEFAFRCEVGLDGVDCVVCEIGGTEEGFEFLAEVR